MTHQLEIDNLLLKLNKMPNEDIAENHNNIKDILVKLEEIVYSYKQVDTLIHHLNDLKIKIIDNFDYINTNKIVINKEHLLKESNMKTKDYLIKKYLETYKKYIELSEYYSAIDLNYYSNILKDLNEIF